MTTFSRPSPDPKRLGIARRLSRICDADGFIRVVAIDHPEVYLALFDPDITKVTFEEVIQSKLAMIRALAPLSTAMLLDPVWSFGQAVATGSLPGNVGLISGYERLYYSPQDSSVGFDIELTLREGWEPQRLADLGCDAVKLVVFFRSGGPASLSAQLHETVARVAQDCHDAQMLLIVEPLWYPVTGESVDSPEVQAERTQSVISSAASFRRDGADIMKVEFPVPSADHPQAAQALQEMSDGIDGTWVLLSAGVGFDGFLDQLGLAVEHGCSGFMAGRSIWGDAVGRLDADVQSHAIELAASRLTKLNNIVRERGTPAWRPAPTDEIAQLVPQSWSRTQAGLPADG